MPTLATRRPLGPALALSLLAAVAPAAAEDTHGSLEEQVELLRQQNAELSRAVHELQTEVSQARDEARAARDAASAPAPVSGAPAGYGAPGADAGTGGALAQTSLGGARLQLLDVSLDVLASAGWSSAGDERLAELEAGGHDPNRRGFNLQQAELSLAGAVDPYFTGHANIVYQIDREGGSVVELEEAYALSTQLPFGLQERGVELKAGQFFTEFGRLNPRHPHQWDWQDQPVVLTRLFGADGMRGPGARVSWLLPLPWYSEVVASAQNAQGETMTSFDASEEVFQERPIGGRPFGAAGTSAPNDLVYLLRWVNGGDLSDTWTGQVGVSGLHGPNATGDGGSTWIYGLDGVLKWRPLVTDHGWPFVKLEGELMRRDYHADSFSGCPEPGPCAEPISLASATLSDWGTYLQGLWGFRRDWAAGLRLEYASGSGASVLRYDGRDDDPFRDSRQRVSPLLEYQMTEFSRLRLQYDYDRSEAIGDAHTVWLGLEIGLGAHGAHSF